MDNVAAVIVTMRRSREVAALLDALDRQIRKPDVVIVVENGSDAATAEVMKQHPGVRHVVSHHNLGGAGGFALGVYTALAAGVTHVWMMDDDGLPEHDNCLAKLLDGSARYAADITAPIIIDIKREDRLAFPFFIPSGRATTRQDLQGLDIVPGFAHLFNGTLVCFRTFFRFGVPDLRLFIRGDEVDFLHSVRRGGGTIITLTAAAFRHPSGDTEVFPVAGKWLNAVVPPGDFKQFHFFRNRGHLVRKHRLVMQALSDWIRYPLHFLVTRKGDWRGLKEWMRLTLRGLRGDFRPYDPK